MYTSPTVPPKHGYLLPQHAKRLLSIYMQSALTVMHVRKTTSAYLPSGNTNMRMTSPKRWKMVQTSAFASGGRPISVMVIVEAEGSFSVLFLLATHGQA